MDRPYRGYLYPPMKTNMTWYDSRRLPNSTYNQQDSTSEIIADGFLLVLLILLKKLFSRIVIIVGVVRTPLAIIRTLHK